MNRKDVSKKLKIISSRIDGEFVYGKNEEESVPISNFATISEVYLFGSSLYKEAPRDIDLDIVTYRTEGQRIFRNFWIKDVDPRFEDRRFYVSSMIKKVLLEGMYKVHINFPLTGASSYYPEYVHQLVWSKGKPDTDKNLQEIWNGEGDIYRDELVQLRNQLKLNQMYKRAFSRLCFSNSDSKKRELIRDLAAYDFYKRELPILRKVSSNARDSGIIEVSEFWEKLVSYLESKQMGGLIPAYWDEIEQ